MGRDFESSRPYSRGDVIIEMRNVITRQIQLATKLSQGALVICIFLLMLSPPADSQDLNSSRRIFQHFDTTDGLSHDNVYDILQDHQGFIWLATENGLNRCDGVDVLSYKNKPGDPLSLAENDINAIIEDRFHRIWIGTWGSGVDCLDPESPIFSHVTAQSDDGHSLQGTRILSFELDDQDGLWVGTWNTGLFRIDLSSGKLEHFSTPTSQRAEEAEQDHVWNLVQDKMGVLWVGTQEGLFFIKDGRSLEPASPGQAWVRGMTQASEGGIYFCGSDGVYHAELTGHEVLRKRIIKLNPGTTITTLYLDHRNILWAGSRRHGLFRIDLSTSRVEIEQHEESDPRSLAFNNIRSIMEDRSHNLWIGTRGGGADRLDLKPPKFGSLTRRDTGLPSDSIWAFLFDHRGDLWIGTDDGLCRLPADGSQLQIYQPDGAEGLSHEKIRALAEDPQGNLWVGTKGGGLDRLNPERTSFRHYKANRKRPEGLASNVITALVALPDGRLWIGTDDHGLEEFDAESGVFVHHPINPEVPGGNRVSALRTSTKGKLWIGTDGGGLSLLDPETQRMSKLTVLSASGGHIQSVAEDSQGMTYVGTHAGLYVLNESLELVQVLTQDDGLPDNTIYGILPSRSTREIWMTTNQGLSRYKTKSGRIRNYGVDDGLVSMGFNDGAAYLGPDGRAFVGGNRGVNFFIPDSVEENPFPPEVVLTGITLPNEPKDPMLQSRSGETLKLPWKDNSLTFHWIGLEFTKPGSIRYAYRLQGYDTAWIDGGRTRQRRYTNLDPGSYFFHVRAANNDGVWSDPVTTSRIRISAPFWKHPLFLLMAFGLLGLVFTLIHHLLSMAVRRRNHELEEQMKLRSLAEQKATRYAGELERATLFDPLTSLPNRALISDRIRVLLNRCRRNPTATFAVLVLDLDEFRIINDSLGHRLGDELLIQLAERLEKIIRSEDTLGRLGGDEFAVILPGTTSSTSLEDFAERIHQVIKPPFQLEQREVSSTASIGMVLGSKDYLRPEDLLRDADTAMYRAKRLGRARQVLFDPGMHLEASNILKLENDLRRALKNREFLLHYQPVIDLQQEEIRAFEALVRWKPPQEDEIKEPAHFLERIRSAGLSRELGSWVLLECCRQASIWNREESRRIELSANLFIQQLLDPGLPDLVRDLLERESCSASILHLEITEEVLIDAPESAITVLSALRELGVEIHLDDFGTGFSSLSYLQRFPVDIVKIDRSFVTSMLQDANSTKIVEAVILLAHGLGKRTIAEGIESADVAHRLKELGCDFGQGYYFSRPVPSEEARKMIRKVNQDWLGHRGRENLRETSPSE